ncbi:MAG: hypothetical protein QOI76_2072, partial [Frankiales bacterium]|nr:hypothetical protein [Frankiales bacterium]
RAAYAQILTLGGSLATWTWTDPRPGLVSRSATTPSHGRAVFAVNWTDQVARATSDLELTDSLSTLGLAPAKRDADGHYIIPARSGMVLFSEPGPATVLA